MDKSSRSASDFPVSQVASNRQSDQSHDFKLERLKFVLSQIDQLNQRIDKYITLYQTILVGIITAIATIFVGASKFGVDPATTRIALISMLGLLFLVSIFLILLVVIGVLSWRDYRNDEAAIFDDVVGHGYRSRADLRNFWRWHETYLIVFVAIIPLCISYLVYAYVIPLVK